MSFTIRDGKFDVVVAAAPRISVWPSAGVRALSMLCGEMGLTVGLFGGETLRVRGVVPLPGTGGLLLVEDIQNRIHRIHARAIVRVNSGAELPDPFPGWQSPALIPISTAMRLRKESDVTWDPSTVVLGSGNRALRFASSLLESGVKEVFCIESNSQWGAKRFAGWEVEKRRFETLGGRLIEGSPLSLSRKSAVIWELRVKDAQGVRVIETARVVSAGPFRDLPGVREHPKGSFLFELEQSAAQTRAEDVEGWALEEERGKWLAGKIVRTLVTDIGAGREELDRVYRRARGRLKRYLRHREEPFTPAYQGKWLSVADSRRIKAFSGVPHEKHRERQLASLECFEDIPCDLCVRACPEDAIEINRPSERSPRGSAAGDRLVLNETKCTGCGACLVACPSSAVLMLQEKDDRSLSVLTLPWRGSRPWVAGELATLVNRKGETLGSGRVLKIHAHEGLQSVEVEVPSHLVWDARGLKRTKVQANDQEDVYLSAEVRAVGEKVEILFDGEKRLVHGGLPASIALFELGRGRATDILACQDGSCGLCEISVDGVKKLACQTPMHKGMAIKVFEPAGEPASEEPFLCPCLGITAQQVRERIEQGNLRSPEAVLSMTHVGQGKCHGQLCMDGFRRVLLEQGLDASQWIDWRFPWSEWVLTPT